LGRAVRLYGSGARRRRLATSAAPAKVAGQYQTQDIGPVVQVSFGPQAEDTRSRTNQHSGVDVVDAPAPYVHWEFILISLPNLILILVMILVFVAALVLPFPRHGKKAGSPRANDDE
jgi:hypothetical protein